MTLPPPDRPRSARRVLKRLAPRIVVIASLCAGLGALSTMVTFLLVAVEQVATQVGGFSREVMKASGGLGCPANPSSWGLRLEGGSEVWAYDRSTLRGENPAAPPLDPALLARLGPAGSPPSPPLIRRLGPPFSGQGGVMIVEVEPGGPCSLLQIRWTPTAQAPLRSLAGLLAGLVVALLSTAGLGAVWVVRPLLRRVTRLLEAARLVGADDAAPAGEEEPDEMGAVERELVRAHERIREDKAALAARNVALAQHLSDVAHDLKTPIASLQLALERLAEQELDDEARAAAAGALQDAVYLESLTDNLRLATTLEQGLPSGEEARCDLGLVVRRVEERFRLLARERGVALSAAWPDEACPVAGPHLWWERALSNVVHNALRYTPAGGHVALVLERGPREGRLGYRVVVLDDGPGAPPEDLARLTERSFRAGAARSREETGDGLGLAIAAEVARRVGARLDLRAGEEGGLRVEWTGPLLEPV